jgi:dGTPase
VSLVRSRQQFEVEEAARLGPFAQASAASRGRLHAQPEHAYRTCFQRRLEYKTQVFVYHEGDHYRNRLTHTLEAGQISRTIARALRLNEELAEAVVLAHDLGHTPFGHAGERVLDELMHADGGFDHNRQSLRIVDWLEDRYPGFRGLNLCYETREGILKHGCHWEHPLPVPEAVAQPTLEAQVADAADEIAYTNHDLDDGLRSGLLSWEELEELELWRETRAAVTRRLAACSDRVRRAQVIVGLIDRLVTDLIESSAARLEVSAVDSPDAVRAAPERLVGLSGELDKAVRELKQFLHHHFYLHPRVVETTDRAAAVLGDLFRLYRERPELLPEHVRQRCAADGEARAVADYVAGMTDRFAIEEHRRRTGVAS